MYISIQKRNHYQVLQRTELYCTQLHRLFIYI